MTQVVPAIIPKTKEQMIEEIERVSGFADRIQIDISDGLFTRTQTWPYNGKDTDYFGDLKAESIGWPKWDNIDYEIHLMVQSPEIVALDWINSGVDTIIAHIEATPDFQNIVNICKKSEISLGIAIMPGTDSEKIKPFINDVDFIQVMGSDKLGNHGAELEEKAKEMIRKLHDQYPEKMIAVDIGVSEETAEELVSLGATKLVSGSAIFEAVHPEDVYNYFKSISVK